MKIIIPQNLNKEELIDMYKFYTLQAVQLAQSDKFISIDLAKLFDKASEKYAEAIENYKED